MIIYETISNIIQNFLMIWFISSFCGYKYSGKIKYICLLTAVISSSFVISVINRFAGYDGILSAASIILFLLYAQICLKDSVWVHIFISLFSMVVVFTIASTVLIATSNISGTQLDKLITEFSGARLTVLCLCRAIEFCVFKFILYIKKKYSLSYKEWLIFIIIAFLTWIEIILFTKAAIIYNGIGHYMFGASIAAIIINILMYYFIAYVNKAMELKTELALLTMQYNNVKSTEKNMKALYENTYGLNHDLEKHFMCISTLAEKADTDGIIKYTDNILNRQLYKMQKIMFTQNDVFNAIMNIRLEICKSKNIYPSINVNEDAISEIPSEDIVILFGNIFDNAIEAAEKTEEKIIILNVQLQGEYISVYMENSFNGELLKDLQTTKQNKSEHGWGMKNIRKVVDKHDGLMKCFTDKNLFCCDILLKRNIS